MLRKFYMYLSMVSDGLRSCMGREQIMIEKSKVPVQIHTIVEHIRMFHNSHSLF